MGDWHKHNLVKWGREIAQSKKVNYLFLLINELLTSHVYYISYWEWIQWSLLAAFTFIKGIIH